MIALVRIWYSEYGVKRGLRDEKGQGVLTGLTNISDWMGKISVLIKEEEDRVSNINCRR